MSSPAELDHKTKKEIATVLNERWKQWRILDGIIDHGTTGKYFKLLLCKVKLILQ